MLPLRKENPGDVQRGWWDYHTLLINHSLFDMIIL